MAGLILLLYAIERWHCNESFRGSIRNERAWLQPWRWCPMPGYCREMCCWESCSVPLPPFATVGWGWTCHSLMRVKDELILMIKLGNTALIVLQRCTHVVLPMRATYVTGIENVWSWKQTIVTVDFAASVPYLWATALLMLLVWNIITINIRHC